MNKKTLYKTVSWRILSLISAFSLSLLFFPTVKEATNFTVISQIMSTVLYYFHELFYKWLRKQGKI